MGTTGRVLDHINRENIDFHNLQTVVLDEADQMLDMGFQEDVEKIMKAILDANDQKHPQFIMFSATMPVWVAGVAKNYTKDSGYKYFDLVGDLKNKTAQTVAHLAINCPFFNRAQTLADLLLCYKGLNGKAIVFAQTKADAN